MLDACGGGMVARKPQSILADHLVHETGKAVKGSGIGREGPRDSIRDMTEERMTLFNC